MVQENSMRNDSYFYSIEHASRKSFYHVLNLSGERPPFMDENGLPGKKYFRTIFLNYPWQYNYKNHEDLVKFNVFVCPVFQEFATEMT